MKKQSFLTGALILMIANAISKILGATLKIPLTYILNEQGMAVYSIAFDAYIMFLSFVISGLPFAISKMIAEANSLKEYARVRKIVKVSTVLLVCIGIVGSVILYFTAPFFAFAMKEEKAVYAIKMIAPSVFFVALGTPFKSYFQGISNMLPPAVSQVVEAVVKLVAGYGLAMMFISFGSEKTAAGAITGVTVGEIVATVILFIAFCFEFNKSTDTNSGTAKEILCEMANIALPLLCASLVSNALSVADTTLVRSCLLKSGLTADEARFLYGAYTGYALTVFHLPVGILATMGVSILPVIAGSIAVGDKKKTNTAIDMSVRITVLISVPCGVLIYFLSAEILDFLFNNSTSAIMLRYLSPCVVSLCVSQMTASILQASGRILLPFFTALIGGGIKLIVGYFFISTPEINIYGAAVSADIAYAVVMCLNLIAIRKCLGLKLNLMAILIKPILSACVMLAVMYFIRGYTFCFTQGGVFYLAVMCFVGGVGYIMMLFCTNALSIGDIKKILKG